MVSKLKVFAYDDAVRYTLSELQELWLDELPKWYKKRKGRVQAPRNVVKLHNVYSLNCNRLRDFEKIQSYLNSIGVTELRARLCFQYRNYTLIKLKYQNGELKQEDYDFAKEEILKAIYEDSKDEITIEYINYDDRKEVVIFFYHHIIKLY